jgi:predicted ester cyclase
MLALAFGAYACTGKPAMNDTTRDQNKAQVRTLFEEGMNLGKWDVIDRLIAAEYVGAQGEKGPDAFKGVVRGLRNAFPDIHYTLDDVVAEGDSVATRWHWSGTHTAAFRAFAPSHKPVSNTGTAIFRLRDGKIIGATIETDRLGFLQQIGVVPPDAVLLNPPAK